MHVCHPSLSNEGYSRPFVHVKGLYISHDENTSHHVQVENVHHGERDFESQNPFLAVPLKITYSASTESLIFVNSVEVSRFVPLCGSPLEVFLSLEHLVCCGSTFQDAALFRSSSRRKHGPKGMTFLKHPMECFVIIL